jgi:tetratricopeptide (TPR) repeat protein
MPPAIENPAKLNLPPAAEQVLQAIFAGYRRVIIRRAFGSSLSGGYVIEVRSIRADRVPELPTVVKMAAISLIQKEWRAYREHIYQRLPYIAEAIAKPVLLPEVGWGGIRYTLMGGGGTFEIMSLSDYCRRSDLTANDVRSILERLLRIMQHLWKYHTPQPDFHLRSSYDRLLPVNLLLQYPPPSRGKEPRLVTPDHLPVDPPKLHDLVRVSGFAVKKVDLVNQTVTLNCPEAGFNNAPYYVRLRLPSLAARAAYQVDQIVHPIEGEVIETRISRLRDEVRRALGQEVNLTDQTVWLSDKVSPIGFAPRICDLPNPLTSLPDILRKTRGVNIASIHGDLNLENILIEPETGLVSLIDFAEAREDHILHDFLRLETEVMTKLVPEILARHDLPPASSLVSLYWQLHCTAFRATGEPPALSHPDLAKPWAMLTLLRQTARHYFFEVDDPTEYYEGLIIYLLGALKFRNLNNFPEHPLPKKVAFWAATLAHQFLTIPPGDPNRPPSSLVPLIDTQPPGIRLSVADPGSEGRRSDRADRAESNGGQGQKTSPITLEAAQQKLAALPLDSIPPPAPLPAGSHMPFSRNPLFVGRQQDLKLLAKTLKGGVTVAISAIETAVATGLGGIGKTQLATEFVHRYGHFFAGGVFWLSFANPEAIPAEIAACGGPGALALHPDFRNWPLEEQVRLVLAAWQSPLPRLLVFDNCEDPELLVKWRLTGGSCRILITSRRADWGATLGVWSLPLDVLRRVESLQLLREHHPDVDDGTLDAIAEALGDLPLALHLAGSYLARYRHTVRPATYLAQLRDPALLKHRSLQGDGISPTGHLQNVSRTIALSYNQLDPDDAIDALALALLTRAACFAPGEPIPHPLLLLTLNLEKDTPGSAFRVEDAVARLVELGLLRVETDDRLRLHRLLVAFIQEVAGDELVAAREAVEVAVSQEAERLKMTGYPALLLAWQPHLRAVTEEAQARGDERGAQLCNVLAMHLWQVGDYIGARFYCERALAIREKVLGEEHPDTALSLNNLGHLLHLLDELTGARSYLERALAISEKTVGEEHDLTALCLNNLGYLLQVQGDLAGARPCHERALAIRKKVLGEEHPETAQSLSNLGYIHYIQGDLDGTRLYLERALAIRQKVLGRDHPDTVFILQNLGELLYAQGDLVKAQETFEQVLAIRREMLGKEHPDTARTLSYLGAVRQDQGNLIEARGYYEQALKIYKARLGVEHAKTRQVREKLAALKAA